MFKPSLKIDKPKDDDEDIKNRSIEGAQMFLVIPTESGCILRERGIYKVYHDVFKAP